MDNTIGTLNWRIWMAKILGERMRVEEDGQIVTIYLWHGIYYVTNIEDKDNE